MRIRRSLTPLCLALLILLAGAGPASALPDQPVSGTVTDSVSGKGIAGVIVTASSLDMPGFYRNVSTEADGTWSLSLWTGSWTFRFDKHLFVREYFDDTPMEAAADPVTVADAPVTHVDAALARTPQGHLQGIVTDGKTGLPLAGVAVEATSSIGDPELWGHTLTDADGAYDLAMAPGTYTVRYSKWGFAERWYRDQYSGGTATLLTVTDGSLVGGEDVVLPRTPVELRGAIKDVDYNELEGIAVEVSDAATSAVLASTSTDEHGFYRIDLSDHIGRSVKVRAHDPQVLLADRHYAGNSSTTDPAQAGVIEVKIGISHQWDLLMSSALRGHVTGHTYNSAGQIVPGVTVRVSTGFRVKDTVSDEQGAYAVDVEVGAGTTVTVTFTPANGSDYAGEVYADRLIGQPGDRVAVSPGQTVTVDSSLTRPCSISGSVGGSDGVPFYWVTAKLYDQAGDLAAETLGQSGSYAFTGLREGTYRVFVPGGGAYRDQYYSGAATLAAATPVTVNAAHPDATADLTLVRTGQIQVGVWAEASDYTGIEGATVRLYNAAGAQVATATSDSGGRAAFDDLDMGTYYVGCDHVGERYLGGFSGGASSLDAAEPVVVSEAAPAAGVLLELVSRRGTALFGLAAPDGGWSDSTSLIATATSLAAGGDTVIAGDFWSGTARVLRHTDEGWTLEARLRPDAGLENLYGRHVAADGETVAVSDYNETGANRDGAGKVYIYRRAAGTWALEQVIKPTGAAYRSFGRALALSGDTLLVGAPEATVGDDKLAGAVYVYTRSGSAWTQRDKLTCASANLDDSFGHAVALQGSTAVIAAPRKDWGGHNCGGEVFVFTGSGADWRQRAAIKPSDGLFVMNFGEAVAYDAGTIAVGCGDSPEAGAVYVYTGAGAAWTQQARLAPSDGMVGWDMGRAVALDGDLLISPAAVDIDAPAGYAAGAGYVFRRTGGAWHQDALLRAPYHGERRWSLGQSVAIAGGDLLMSAPSEPRVPNAYGWLHAFHPYVTGLGQALTVPKASGVLTNDTSPEGAAITAVLVTGPSHGALDLRADGSFSYTPAQGWAGDDTFTYTATDGAWTSDPTTVTVTTRDPNAPNVSAEGVPKGWVNTPVTVTLSAGDDTQVREIDYRRKTARALAWTTYDKPFTVQAQGATTYQLRALDIFCNASRTGTVTVKVDTRKPVPKVPRPVIATRGKTAVIVYQIADPRPGSPTADVEIHVLKAGKEKTNFMLPRRPVGKLLTYRFRCTLPRGRYVLQISAVDAAGNVAGKPGTGSLTVK